MDDANLRWWGWGTTDRSYPEAKAERILKHLQKQFGFPAPRHAPPLPLDEVRLRPALLPRGILERFENAAPLRTDLLSRLLRTYGKSYRDLVRLRRGEVPHPPDAVARPRTPEEVRRVLALAAAENVAVVPFGGGTSVVGGVEGPAGRPFLTLDTRGLAALLDLDRTSLTATFQAGVLGPALEEALRDQSLTLGHFPQSFEFSTLGGWVATRSAGQASTYYGKIEDMVQAVRVELPDGTFRTPRVPATAAGPGLLDVMVGSEGILGVISEVTVRVRPVPDAEQWRGFYMPRFPDAVDALRRLVQRGLLPAVARLSDPSETRFALSTEVHGLRGGMLKWLGTAVLSARARREQASLLVLGFEGSPHHVDSSVRAARGVLKQAGGVDLGAGPARAWATNRFELPYLRDDLLSAGILVETLETATSWSNLLPLHARLTESLEAVLSREGWRAPVLTHLSHLYPDGASLYVTFMAPVEDGRELDLWEQAKSAACRAILEGGGTLTHHHGLGADHARWTEAEIGPVGMRMLQGLKAELDPGGILNPGKVLPSPRP